MTSVHTVRPTDLVALVAYNGRVYPNESVTRDRIGSQGSPHPLETALEQWFSFAAGRHTCISVKGATLRGLVSARKRGSRAAWEVDCLIDAAEDDPGVLLSLLDRVTADAGRAGAEKVFLRVAATSDVVRRACAAGFAAYLTERLLAAAGGRARSEPQPEIELRRSRRADAYPIFQLYNRWTPEPVRRLEAATFREWTAARERLSPGATRQLLAERGGRMAGSLRAAADGELGRFDVMADAAQPELLDGLIDAALERLAGQPALFTLVPEFAPALRERLKERGFEAQGEFVVLARRTVRPVAAPEFAPATTA
jgi:hypothetical protein